MLRSSRVVVRHDAGLAVVELDRQGGLGDVDRDGPPRVNAPEGDLLTADHDDSGVGRAALDVDRLGRLPRWWETTGVDRRDRDAEGVCELVTGDAGRSRGAP